MEQLSVREISVRLISARSEILKNNPFFGRLLMRLPFGFTECGTAYTDMRKIVFDPEFANRLNDRELSFVILHELMHCVLKHCTRGKGKLHYLYNIACDIVVNSVILEAMSLKDMEIDGVEVMHLSPDGTEGRNFSAEELYTRLLKDADEKFTEKYGVSIFDSHQIWEKLADDPLVEEIWDTYVKHASKQAGTGSGIPDSIERYVSVINHKPRISWKQILHDFIQNDRCDYLFSKPDTRYSGDIIMPSFQENADGVRVDKVFFFVDTSGSVTDDAIAEAFAEIKDAVRQIGNMTGVISFFDFMVSEPIPFDSVEDIAKIKPVGGGGTSFKNIFKYISRYDEDERPNIIIIMTDGYAEFPEESEALGIPVIWLIIDSEVDSPWGECLHIYSDKEK